MHLMVSAVNIQQQFLTFTSKNSSVSWRRAIQEMF